MEHVFCMQCGQKIAPSAQACPHCGAQQALAAVSSPTPAQATPQSSSPCPEGVKGWSWGAFWLSWIWAIFNKTWIGLLALIPMVNLVMMVILGLKGREWAWRNKSWPSIEHFNRVQKKWSLAGWIVVGASLILGIIAGAVEDWMKHRDASDITAEWSLDDGASNNSPTSGNSEHTDVSAPQTASPYPIPRLSFGKADLLGAMKRSGMEQQWITEFTNYLSQPGNFWQGCVTQEAGSAQTLGGMGQKEAQAHGESACQSLAQQYYDCLNGRALDDAVLCLQTHINDVAENGD